ncbi:M20/M25/M40 family metallo-hydrolase [Candidatus Peregrinibacteria bacterium]|nr:M20/M25/M40 family metallo-hydrolase [Candidatus Peregrinibacteria bacterium]
MPSFSEKGPLDLIRRIEEQEENDKRTTKAKGQKGRYCFTLSEFEDRTIDLIRNYALELFREYEVPDDRFEIKTDAFGNLYITLFGKDRSRTVASGSHADSVNAGGYYDGLAGINSAINFLEKLLESGQTPECNYTAIAFRAEESSPKTGVACLGSQVAAGLISEEQLEKIMYDLTPAGDGENKSRYGKIPLKEHIERRYGPEKWGKILEQVRHPELTKDRVSLYEELHIEQSKVIRQTRKDVGIVIEGIGGNCREEINLPASQIPTATIKNPSEYKKLRINVVGEQAHTGGMPPNPTFQKNPSEKTKWYRSDALVAGSILLRWLTEALKEKRVEMHLKEIFPAEAGGYTTVPANIMMDLVIKKSDYGSFFCVFDKIKPEIEQNFDVSALNMNGNSEIPSAVVLDTEKACGILGIPLILEETARTNVYSDPPKRIRCTAVDFVLSPEQGLSFKIDYRDVNTEAFLRTRNKIDAQIREVLRKNLTKGANVEKGEGTVWRIISEKKYAAVCALAAQTKQDIATILGLKSCPMPSMPGHDASSMSLAAIPTSMTFVAHDGKSHDPDERMSENDYLKAECVSHAFLAQKLGVTLARHKKDCRFARK